MHRLDSMEDSSLHPDICSDNIHDALGDPERNIWADGVQKQYASLGMTSPISVSIFVFTTSIDHLAVRKAILAQGMSVWEGLHILLRGARTWGANLCVPICSGLQGQTNSTQLQLKFVRPGQSSTRSCSFQRQSLGLLSIFRWV